MTRARCWPSLVLLALDAAALAALLLLPAAWLLDPARLAWGPLHLTVHWGAKPVLAAILLALARAAAARRFARQRLPARGLWDLAVIQKLTIALVSTIVFFALLETVLGWTRFDAVLPPIIFQGRNADGGIHVPDTLPDPQLLFKMVPGGEFQGRRINTLGFREREVAPRKAPGTRRVVCLGDSVTAQGRPCGYAGYLQARLRDHPPTPHPWEAFHIGVHGYTALQGLRLFQMLGASLEPDIVTVYFGWNDHWLSEEADRQKMGLQMRPFAGRIVECLRGKRFFRFVLWLLHPVQPIARRAAGADRVFRVPPDEYRAVLTALVREIRAAGARPLLLTAPSRSVTAEVVDKQYVRSIEQGNRTHAEYVAITRDVARATGADLLDLAALMAGHDCDPFFARDGIHFDSYSQEGYLPQDPPDQPGLRRIAEELDRKLRELAPRLTP